MRLSPWMPPNKHTHQAVRDASVSGAITTCSACTSWQEGSMKKPAMPAQPPLGGTLESPLQTLWPMYCALLFKDLPCAQAEWHHLNYLSVPKAALLLFSRNFVRWEFQSRSAEWHKSYYTEIPCSRHLKCGQSDALSSSFHILQILYCFSL